MPDFSETTRNRLYNDTRAQIERVDRTPEGAGHRRFIAFGQILGLTKAGVLREAEADELLTLLQVTSPPQVGERFEADLRVALFDLKPFPGTADA